ncbi:hypothetical protein [Saccharibacillus qingshengii]|uniref:hypothetical protein n=1 Tax=Saccharibacillus qingshengii TaxID=1763540 RepID=UPI001553A7EE|nr:hypothetical protein [Saccharibacillus qingshengii]
MKISTHKLLKKVPAVLLTSAFVFGAGASALTPLSSASAETVSSAPAASALDLTAPAKAELIIITQAALTSWETHPNLPDHEEGWVFVELQNKALKLIADPNASASQLQSTSRQLEKATRVYDDRHISSHSSVGYHLARTYASITGGEPPEGQNLTPYQLAVLDVVDQTFAMMAKTKDTNSSSLDAYQYFKVEVAKLEYLRTPDLADYRAKLAEYQARAVSAVETLERLGADYQANKADFDRSAAFLQTLLSGTYETGVYEIAVNDVLNYRELLIRSANLAERIDQAKPLLDSPRGTQPGQYPASAFGKLKRALNNAQRVLDNDKTADEMMEAGYQLNRTAEEFKASVKS